MAAGTEGGVSGQLEVTKQMANLASGIATAAVCPSMDFLGISVLNPLLRCFVASLGPMVVLAVMISIIASTRLKTLAGGNYIVKVFIITEQLDYPRSRIRYTGNTMLVARLWYANLRKKDGGLDVIRHVSDTRR